MQPYCFEFVYFKNKVEKVIGILSQTLKSEYHMIEIHTVAFLFIEELAAAAKKDSAYKT